MKLTETNDCPDAVEKDPAAARHSQCPDKEEEARVLVPIERDRDKGILVH